MVRTTASREVIKSRSNPVVRELRGLLRSSRDQGLLVVEGVRLCEEALSSGLALTLAAATPEMARQPRGAQLLADLEGRHVPLRWLHASVLAALSDVDTSQGVLLVARRPDLAAPASALGGLRALALVIAGVQDPGNVGSLMRVAEAAGVTRVVVAEGSADPFSPKALRGGMGSTFRLPVQARPAVAEIAAWRRAGTLVWAAAGGGTRYDEIDWRPPSALVVGNEGAGIPAEVLRACDGTVTVPMAGRVESLNVAVAAGVVLFEAARQRRGSPGKTG